MGWRKGLLFSTRRSIGVEGDVAGGGGLLAVCPDLEVQVRGVGALCQCRLSDRTDHAAYGYRRSPYGQRAKISRDGGQTWSREIVLDDQGIDGDLGYPCTVELPDGSLITAYYQKLPGDNFCSVLYTKWTLAEFDL